MVGLQVDISEVTSLAHFVFISYWEPILSSQVWNDLRSKQHPLYLKILLAVVWKHLSIGNLTFRVCIYKSIYLSLFINVRAICICAHFSFLIWFTMINAFSLSLKKKKGVQLFFLIGDSASRSSIHLTLSIFCLLWSRFSPSQWERIFLVCLFVYFLLLSPSQASYKWRQKIITWRGKTDRFPWYLKLMSCWVQNIPFLWLYHLCPDLPPTFFPFNTWFDFCCVCHLGISLL